MGFDGFDINEMKKAYGVYEAPPTQKIRYKYITRSPRRKQKKSQGYDSFDVFGGGDMFGPTPKRGRGRTLEGAAFEDAAMGVEGFKSSISMVKTGAQAIKKGLGKRSPASIRIPKGIKSLKDAQKAAKQTERRDRLAAEFDRRFVVDEKGNVRKRGPGLKEKLFGKKK